MSTATRPPTGEGDVLAKKLYFIILGGTAAYVTAVLLYVLM